jgi:hypothetical protein
LNCLILARLEIGSPDAAQSFSALADRSEAELTAARARVAARIVSGVSFSSSEPRLAEAFMLAKANLALLTADYRPFFPDVCLAAGVAVYPRLFACDSTISLRGAMAADFRRETRGTLACLAAQTRSQSSLTPHESANDATIIGPANAQETPQFIATCAKYFRWSGDRQFISDLYPLLKDALVAERMKFDRDGDGYPEGAALIEAPGMGPEKIDAACWQYAALAALAEIADALGETGDAASFSSDAAALRGAIRREWWIAAQDMWADSLEAGNQQRLDGMWSVVFPLLTGVANPEQAQLTLNGLQAGWVNQWGGVHTRQPDISGQASGVVTTELFANAAFAHGQPEFGINLLRLAAEAPRQERMPGAFTETIPPGGSDSVQLWSVGPFLEGVIEGMAGVEPDASQHRADFRPQLPGGIEWFKLERLRIGEHELTLEHRRSGSRAVATITHESGPLAFRARFFSSLNAEFRLNGKNIPSERTYAADGLADGTKASCDLLPRDKLVVTSRRSFALPVTLVTRGADWKYLDDGSDQGTAWRALTFNDSSWRNGRAEFGYGDGDETTIIRSNRTDGSRIITTYFRKSFVATNSWSLTNLMLSLVRDDGAIVFLNGIEVFRSNMPSGPVGYLTTALVAIGGADESAWLATNLSPALVVDGTNIMAVEIHQQSTTSSDVSFDLALNATGFNPPELVPLLSSSRLELVWPLFPSGFSLESAAGLSSDASWQIETSPVAVTNGENNVTFEPIPTSSRFYRLHRR